jgi:hypothetical protein
MDRIFKDVAHSATPLCLQIIGPPRICKSSAALEFEALYPPVREPEGLIKHVVYVRAPSNGTIKALLEETLKALGDPHFSKGSRDQMVFRLRRLLKQVQCRMLILDEAQHLADKGQKSMLDRASDLLKSLVEDRRFALVLLGLPESRHVVTSNPQLVDRFRAPIVLEPFDWSNPRQIGDFRGLVAALCEALTPYEFPDLAGNRSLAFRAYLACAGKVGLMVMILDEAVRAAHEEHRLAICLEHLQKAYDTTIYFAERFPLPGGPFLCDLSLAGRNDGYDQALAQAVLTLSGSNPGTSPEGPQFGSLTTAMGPDVLPVTPKSSRRSIKKKVQEIF